MADSGARNNLSVTPPNQILKDLQGADNSIPLSPQWLLPKPGESKTGLAPGENHSRPGFGKNLDAVKPPGNDDDMHGSQKKKSVFRPTFLDMDSGRREHWRDEERDTNPSIRKDRWKDGDKELGDSRKSDRWVETPPPKHLGDVRRAPSDRWTDPTRETNYEQRRESKWNSRWGPDDKEMSKWSESGKTSDGTRDKGVPHFASHGKDDKEGDHYRPWRSSSLQGRGRGDPSHPHIQVPSKEGHTFGHGRGRGDNAPTFSHSRGRVGSVPSAMSNVSAHSHPLGIIADKGDHGQRRETPPFKYSRTKLLDVYRLTDVGASQKMLNGFVEVPSLTQEEPVEPLALCAPMGEELSVLKGIDKGDIVSSGAPQNTKDGSVGRGSADFVQPRRPRLASREDVSVPSEDTTDSTDHSTDSHLMYADNRSNVGALNDEDVLRKADELPITKDIGSKGHLPASSGTPWRSPSLGERAQASSRDWSDIQARNPDISWSQSAKGRTKEREGSVADSSYQQNDLKWNLGEDPVMRRQSSITADRELESREILQPSPEDLVLFYKDPQGQIQGPFSGGDIIGWFESGYFGIDLQVRLANAPKDSPFSLLGDVMPHLRSKPRPPPGFSVSKQNEFADVSSRTSLSNFGKPLPGSGAVDLIRNDQRLLHGASTEAENRFLESLMSGNMSSSQLERFASSEGLQGYSGHSSSGMATPLGVESGDALNLLTKRMALERQRSMSNPYPYWPARDGSYVVPTSEMHQESPIPQSQLLSSIVDAPRQPSHPQGMDMMSVLQGLSDRSSVGVNNGGSGWSNFPLHGALDPLKNKIELNHGPGFPTQGALGIQQHRLPLQSQIPIGNVQGQSMDNPSSILSQEQLLSPVLSQDPQINNLLQQQYLLQLQSLSSLPAQQLPLLEKMLLLKQQQKQEEQQQLLRQQQQLLSQVLSEHQSKRFGEASYGQLPAAAGMSSGNTPIDHLLSQLSHQTFPVGAQVPAPIVQGDKANNVANVPPPVPQDVGCTVDPDSSSLQLPHQMFGSQQMSAPTQNADADALNFSWASAMKGSSALESVEKLQENLSSVQHSIDSECYAPLAEQILQSNSSNEVPASVASLEIRANNVPSNCSEVSVAKPSVVSENETLIPKQANSENETLIPKQENVGNALPATADEDQSLSEKKVHNDVVTLKEVPKNVDVRETKKTSEKKSKKKSSKMQSSSEHSKGDSRTASLQEPQQLESALTSRTEKKLGSVTSGESLEKSLEKAMEVVNLQEVGYSAPETLENKREIKHDQSITQHALSNAAQRAWKPAVNVKPKSLLEIQQEEQQRAQSENPVSLRSAPVSSISSSAPWAGVIASSDSKSLRDASVEGGNDVNVGKPENPNSKKSQLHDLLAAEVLAKSSASDNKAIDAVSALPSPPVASQQSCSFDDGNFIEAKDTKKSRKKSAKSKASANKASASISSAEVAVASSPVDKAKSYKSMQQDKEVVPAPPSGPSLGDFVPWKGEPVSPSPAQAWSTESGKHRKPTSLRDILKEEEKKFPAQPQLPMSTPQKSQSMQVPRTTSRSVTGSAPSKTTSPVQINVHASQSKHKGDDDFFWGPPEQSKPEVKQAEFPQLGNQGSLGNRNTPVKGTSGASLSRQKSVGGRAMDLSPSPVTSQPSRKGKKGGNSKYSEAMDFRDWCEGQSVRLTGSNDTSFLEFCSKQPRSEAEILLTQNLGSLDPNHQFIDQFLNYMDMLPRDVLEIAFQARDDQKVSATVGGRDMSSDNRGNLSVYEEDTGNGSAASAKSGKKKGGKKGKKVSAAVLGFNVVSNRIMMGEIQNVED